MTKAHILGYPRIGQARELKFALEAYWQDKNQAQLLEVGKKLRRQNWQAQLDAGLDFVTVGDFAWYDQVLNTSLLLGHIPKRHQSGEINLETLFSMARGAQDTAQEVETGAACGCHHQHASSTISACDMTKWFNTNYHYIVPEFTAEDNFQFSWTQLFDEVEEAKAQGFKVKASVIGPLTYLYLGQAQTSDLDKLSLLAKLLPIYQEVIQKLDTQGVEWLQIEEPILGLDLDEAWQAAFVQTYQGLKHQRDPQGAGTKLLLTSYFESILDKKALLTQLDVAGIHFDLVAGKAQLPELKASLKGGEFNAQVISLGVVNGRNVWRCELDKCLSELEELKDTLGDNLWIGSSCSLLHSPLDLELEQNFSAEQKSWFAFAKQKLTEVAKLSAALSGNANARQFCLEHAKGLQARLTSKNVHKENVEAKLNALKQTSPKRKQTYAERAIAQKQALDLPLLATTTIGSFPQTTEIRKQRLAFKRGEIDFATYQASMQVHIKQTIALQEELGLDVFVHGEAERNDMVEYFAQALEGFLSSDYAWVQSYGSRCVKPAIIISDIERKAPITLDWLQYAQSCSNKPVKGMLTGPVTILCWTFEREDISREKIANQIALALRDEVEDLEAAGIGIIQIDEPAIREGMPLKQSEHQAYLDWAVRAFQYCASEVQSQTQIHTHMCYSDFNSIIESVAALDADVITIETSRSNMALLEAFEAFAYPNEIGPGVYDIHSPNVPSVAQIEDLLERAIALIPIERLWVNPDCGLKTRGWEETKAALVNMVKAADNVRHRYA